jgi:hypothetical protein
MQLDPHPLRLAPSQCERGMADAYDEGVAAGPRLGEDLDLFAMHEAELEEPALESRQGVGARADADNRSLRARRHRRQAHESGHTAHPFWAGHSIHGYKYG